MGGYIVEASTNRCLIEPEVVRRLNKLEAEAVELRDGNGRLEKLQEFYDFRAGQLAIEMGLGDKFTIGDISDKYAKLEAKAVELRKVRDAAVFLTSSHRTKEGSRWYSVLKDRYLNLQRLANETIDELLERADVKLSDHDNLKADYAKLEAEAVELRKVRDLAKMVVEGRYGPYQSRQITINHLDIQINKAEQDKKKPIANEPAAK